MPNCDWYGTPADNKPILDFIFSEGTCDVYESHSEAETPLQQFTSSEEVLAQFENTYSNGKKEHSVHLQLYVKGSGPPFTPRRYSLNPERCDGATYRYSADGMGLVQLYIERCVDGVLLNSHTNRNSEKRAANWFDPDEIPLWDFKAVSRFSSRLNRQIRKLGVAKLGSQVVLPEASELWKSGARLMPYDRKTHAELFVEG